MCGLNRRSRDHGTARRHEWKGGLAQPEKCEYIDAVSLFKLCCSEIGNLFYRVLHAGYSG
jgi:hypothetical protein